MVVIDRTTPPIRDTPGQKSERRSGRGHKSGAGSPWEKNKIFLHVREKGEDIVKKMNKTELKTFDSAFKNEVIRLKLDQDIRFRETVEAYEFQVEMITGLREAIAKEGYKIEIPAGRDAVKLVSNPSISDLNKAEILAQKLRMEIDAKIEKAKQAVPAGPALTL